MTINWRAITVMAFLLSPVSVCFAWADNVLHPAAPVVDRPTLMTLGVQMPVTGDDNFNATVTVRYRQSGSTTWKTGLPLYRVHTDVIFNFSSAPQFSGSVFDLRPNTTYDIELHATDPDGPVDQTFTVSATTRAIPGDPVSPRAVSVSTSSQLQSALSNAQAGDVITLAPGTYTGQFGIGNSGSALNPIVIRGASQTGVILDGLNCTGCNILEVYGSYTHVENLTLQSAERAIRFQSAGSVANVVRRVIIKNTTMGIGGRLTQYDFYIADNILQGRLSWPQIYTDDGGAHADDDGINLTGHGMVVAHNQISGYGDAMKNSQWGARSLDVYGNDVLYSYDNAIELDTSEGNVRAMRNRFTNVSTPLSVQPVFAGPAYIMRNVVSNAVDEQIKFHGLNIGSTPSQPNGVLVYHNTFLSPYNELQVQTPIGSHHFTLENNLFIAPSTLPGYAVNWDAPIDDGTFDYNGYYPNGSFLFRWISGYGNYANFAALQSAGVERHGVLLPPGIFASGLTAPTNYQNLMAPPDASLSSSGGAIDRGLVLPNVNDGFSGSAPDLGALELGCPAPIFGPRAAGVDETNEPLGCTGGGATPIPPPAPAPGTATFIKTDTTTQGNWSTAYGSEGANVIADSSAYPSYVSVTPSNNGSWVWASSTADTRALSRRSAAGRIAACWVNNTTFSIGLNFTDSQSHQVALYLLDWDNWFGRSERVEILNSAGTVLDTRTVSSFVGGQYLVWNLSGTVTIRITNLNGSSNAVVSGLFFGGGVAAPVPAAAGAASFVKVDTTTQGSWKTAYGSEGASVIGDSVTYPSYASVTPAGNFSYVWTAATTDPRATQRASTTGRLAACWGTATTFTIDLNFTDGQTHQVAMYLLDWDNWFGRSEKIEILNTAGAVLDTRSVSSFVGGQYLVWNLSGHVTVRVTNTNPLSNAVVSGLFFGGGVTASGQVAYLKTDTTTLGSWKGVYGRDGANIIGDSAAYPSYVTVNPSNNGSWVWSSFTGDSRALSQRLATGRVAACWVNNSTFSIDLNFTDGATHQFAMYMLDWDNYYGRSQTVEILNSSGVVVDTRTVTQFTGGQYLVWNLSGHVTVRVTNTNAQSNAVVSGLFFGPGA